MPSRDPTHELAAARRRYERAVTAVNDTTPGTQEYRKAVHEVGVAWGLMQRWQHALADELARRRRPDPRGDDDGRRPTRRGRWVVGGRED